MTEKILHYKFVCERDVRYTQQVIDSLGQSENDVERIKSLKNRIIDRKLILHKINTALSRYRISKDDNILYDLALSLQLIKKLPRTILYDRKPKIKVSCGVNHQRVNPNISIKTIRKVKNDGFINTTNSIRAVSIPMGGANKKR